MFLVHTLFQTYRHFNSALDVGDQTGTKVNRSTTDQVSCCDLVLPYGSLTNVDAHIDLASLDHVKGSSFTIVLLVRWLLDDCHIDSVVLLVVRGCTRSSIELVLVQFNQ